ncbi:MAG: electron transport complex subunit E [Prevotellaceae bacterium]|jgi:electron transport complex protein RnfE|nr:electron transport complex subunit E [Prevotellaceae bacterium]
MKERIQIILKGIFRENPTFVLVLGMCPTLATTSSAINGLSMGLATAFVLMLSNMTISLVGQLIPDKVRIPSYVVIIAAFVTVVDLLMAGYLPDIHNTLGIFIPLIVVNCIVLARAESFAAKNGAVDSVFDGLGIGLGFTLALTFLGFVRELLGSYSVFGHKLASGDGIILFILAPGAFFVLAYLMILFNIVKKKFIKK